MSTTVPGSFKSFGTAVPSAYSPSAAFGKAIGQGFSKGLEDRRIRERKNKERQDSFIKSALVTSINRGDIQIDSIPDEYQKQGFSFSRPTGAGRVSDLDQATTGLRHSQKAKIDKEISVTGQRNKDIAEYMSNPDLINTFSTRDPVTGMYKVNTEALAAYARKAVTATESITRALADEDFQKAYLVTATTQGKKRLMAAMINEKYEHMLKPEVVALADGIVDMLERIKYDSEGKVSGIDLPNPPNFNENLADPEFQKKARELFRK